MFSGWKLTGLAAFGVLAMCGAILAIQGSDGDAIRLEIRATARTSLVFFLAAYVASSLRRLHRSPATAWLLRNRRYVGVSYAVSHLVHAVFIVWLAVHHPSAYESDAATVVFGGLGFVFTFLLAVTSSDAAVRRLGTVRWRRLHRVGVHYIWFIFAFTTVSTFAMTPSPLYFAMAAAPFLALAIRIAARVRVRRPAAPVTASGS